MSEDPGDTLDTLDTLEPLVTEDPAPTPDVTPNTTPDATGDSTALDCHPIGIISVGDRLPNGLVVTEFINPTWLRATDDAGEPHVLSLRQAEAIKARG